MLMDAVRLAVAGHPVYPSTGQRLGRMISESYTNAIVLAPKVFFQNSRAQCGHILKKFCFFNS